jgi:lipopolysaccharide transport system ATP-binding protein
VSLPGRPGQYECTLALESYWLASGEYCFDLMTGLTNVDTDHRVDNALRFFVERCSPDAIPFNFSQGKGNGALALRLAGPIEFTELPPAGQEPKPGPG